MRFPRRPSLATKARLAFFLASGLALLLAAVVFVAYGAFALHTEAVRDLSRIANLLVGAAAAGASLVFTLLIGLRLARQIGAPRQDPVRAAKTRADAQDDSAGASNPVPGELADSVDSSVKHFETRGVALRDSREYLLSVLDKGPYLILLLGEDQRIQFASSAAEELLGYRRSELIGQDISDLVRTDASDWLRTIRARSEGAADRSPSFEAAVRAKDGSWHPHEITLSNLVDDPTVGGIVLVAHDISARKALEEENRNTQELLETVFENGPDLIFVKDASDFRYVRVNKAFEKALGFSRQNVVGKTDFDLFPKEEAEFFRAKDQEALNSRQSVDIQEEPVDTRDGQRRIVRTKKLPIAFDSDRAQYLVGIAEDITAQKQAARALEISEERYRSVLEHAADAFFLHDLHGRFVDVNRRACESLGYTRDELLGLSVPDIEMDFDATKLDAMWRGIPLGFAHSLEGLHRRKDGTTFPVEVRLARVPLEDVSWVMALVRDVSARRLEERELKAAKEQAERANRLKSEFLANVSHEIRTPMNAVIGMTDLLTRTQLTRKQQDYVQTVRSSGDLLLSVIDDILDFSKLEAGELRLEARTFEVDDVVESVLSMLGYRAYAKDVELACRCRLGIPPRLIGDPDRLRQVLVNLVGNAIKFTEHGEVIVEVSPLADTADEVILRFAVQDTGPGIPPEFRDRLFTPFSQWDTSTTRRYRGTGLGLAICKKLVEKMGGEIAVQSRPGEGSTFSFKMPFRRASQVSEPPSALRGRRALVVDDNPVICGALGDFLTTLGMRHDSEARGAAALARLRREAAGDDPYDVALIDTEMPSNSGLDLARQIRADPPLAATGLVLLPSIARPLGPGVVSTLPGARCVNKPVLPRLLRQQIAATLGLSAAQSGDAATVRDGQGVADETQHAGARILVGEDNAVSRALLLDMLETLGYTARGVADGRAALAALDAERYDVVLLDCQMPEMDGYEVAAELRSRRSDVARPAIIAVTAHASADDRERCLQAGMDDYLSKPVRLEELSEMLEEWTPSLGAATEGPSASTISISNTENPLDADTWESLQLRGATDPAFLEGLIELFLSDTETRLTALAESLEQGRVAGVARDAHALKAGCLQVGARHMAELCDTIHRAGETASRADLAVMLECLLDEFSQVRAFLEGKRRGRD